MIGKLFALVTRRRRYVYRSALTGKFIPESVAKAHPELAVRERVA